jgi:hypothetical protein
VPKLQRAIIGVILLKHESVYRKLIECRAIVRQEEYGKSALEGAKGKRRAAH